MRGAVMYAPGDVRVEERDDPRSCEPTDAIIRVSAACVCGSDLWPYRGIEDIDGPRRWATSTPASSRRSAARSPTIKPGQFVVGSFFASDNTCEICRAGYQSACVHREPWARCGAQAEFAARPARRRHPRRHPRAPAEDLIPSLLGRLRRARHRLVRRGRRRGRPGQDRRGRRRRRGRPARRPGRQAARRRADHRHEPARVRQKLALEFGATDIVDRTRRRGRGRRSRSSPTGSARTR